MTPVLAYASSVPAEALPSLGRSPSDWTLTVAQRIVVSRCAAWLVSLRLRADPGSAAEVEQNRLKELMLRAMALQGRLNRRSPLVYQLLVNPYDQARWRLAPSRKLQRRLLARYDRASLRHIVASVLAYNAGGEDATLNALKATALARCTNVCRALETAQVEPFLVLRHTRAAYARHKRLWKLLEPSLVRPHLAGWADLERWTDAAAALLAD